MRLAVAAVCVEEKKCICLCKYDEDKTEEAVEFVYANPILMETQSVGRRPWGAVGVAR
jgi:hypothetical protein